MTAADELIERTLRYCADCLVDFKSGDQITECAACEGLLHEHCSRCICERVKQEQRRLRAEDPANAPEWAIECQVDHLTRYCVDCLADFTDEELYHATKCKVCTARLHAGCSRCICERIKKESGT